MLQQTLRCIFFLVFAFAAAVGVRATIWAGPIIVNSLHRPSLRPACDGVRPGMTVSEVQKSFDGAKPFNEAMIGAELRFEGKDTCEVTLDVGSQRVLSTQFREKTIGGVE